MINLIYRAAVILTLAVITISLVIDILTHGVLTQALSVDHSVSFGEVTIIIILLAQSLRARKEKKQ